MRLQSPSASANWREIVLFTVLACGLSWAYFGPLLAALLMQMFVSREGLRDSMGWKRPFKFYLLALTTPILFFGILALFTHLTGLGRFTWARADMPLGAYLGLEFLIGAFSISIFILGDEYGWRGYLLPRAPFFVQSQCWQCRNRQFISWIHQRLRRRVDRARSRPDGQLPGHRLGGVGDVGLFARSDSCLLSLVQQGGLK